MTLRFLSMAEGDFLSRATRPQRCAGEAESIFVLTEHDAMVIEDNPLDQ
jgi:hypothetical protein